MPKTLVRRRSLAVVLVAAAIGVTTVVLLSGQTSSARAAVAPGSTVRASVVSGTNTEAAEGGQNQELAAGGTALVFTSSAKLDDLDTGEWTNVYVRDLARDRTVMISRGMIARGDGAVVRRESPPNGNSYQPTISADGRYVAFVTTATDIVAEDADESIDLLVCDRDPDGDDDFDEQLPDGGGRDYKCFRVNQPQWEEVPGGPSVNSDSGTSDGSSGSGGTDGSGGASDGSGTSDGSGGGTSDGSGSYRYRTDYPSEPKLSDRADRIVWKDQTGGSQVPYRRLVRTAFLGTSVTPPNEVVDVKTPIDGLDPQDQADPDVSGDGRFIVLTADFFGPTGGSDGRVEYQAIMRKDMNTGAVLRVDWDLGTTGQVPIYVSEDQTARLANPAISGDGAVIAFEAEEYHDACSDGCWRSVADQPVVYVVQVPEFHSAVVSRNNDGIIANGVLPSLSGDGRFVSFVTDNFKMHDGIDDEGETRSCIIRRGGDDTVRVAREPMVNLNSVPPVDEARNERTSCQVVVRDLVVDRTRLVNEDPPLPGTLASPGPDNNVGNESTPPSRSSTAPSLSNDGSTIGYDSDATNLVPGQPDGNERTDTFVRTFRPELRADPNPLEFGSVQVRDRFDQTVAFDHVGLGPLVVRDIEVAGRNAREFAVGAQTCSGEAVVLQQTDRCEVSVGFVPNAAGDRVATLRLTLRDGRVFTVDLRGTGSAGEVPPRPDSPRFAAGPDPVAFGPRLLLSSGVEPTVTITNRGLSPLTVRAVTVVSALAPNDYAVASNTCAGAPVLPGAQCRLTVRFSPTAPGDRTAVLRFDDNAPGGPHLIGLTGTGSTPSLEAAPAVTQPGRVIAVTGLGFPPDRAITVTMLGSVDRAVVRTAADGTFRASLLVLSHSQIGSRQIVATVDTFPTIKAEKPVLIVTPTVSPADFVVRG